MQLSKITKAVSVVVLVAGMGFSGVAMAVTQEMCGPSHINPKHECCYANQEYAVGSPLKEGKSVYKCREAGANGHTDAHWSSN
ncbi:hypothetical protein [Acidithiobacillus ferridurans]|uniref:hypothetical protein n=1 Tax=Acidithiobacillus ferridurans TaxID=1232575 RepID=UPI0011BE77D0|nr:hypothetical protein [Acidithiobacillus ferridurans]